MTITSIHASEPGNFFKCPFKWLCREQCITPCAVSKRPAETGTVLHKIISSYYKTIKDKTITAGFIERYINAHYNGIWKKEGIPYMKRRADRCIKNFIIIEKLRLGTWKSYKPTFTEKTHEHGILIGTPDFYSEKDAAIIDWKTGKTDHIDEDMLIQGSIYKVLLRKLGFPVKRVYFALLYPGLFLEMPTTTDGWLHDKLKEMITMVKMKQFPKIESGLCTVCEYTMTCSLGDKCLWSEW